ncbi:MAG: hypothetical protein V4607_01870 [Pseudomonadota bacterium]
MGLESTAPPIPTQSLHIGLTAYEAMPGLVFVRVPNEKGRWILTDRCVAEVDCPHCKAVVGEPCKRDFSYGIRYHSGTHCYRRDAARQLRGFGYSKKSEKPKLRIRVEDMEAAMAIEPVIVSRATGQQL